MTGRGTTPARRAARLLTAMIVGATAVVSVAAAPTDDTAQGAAPTPRDGCEQEVAGLTAFSTNGTVPVLFVHGWTGSGAEWDKAIDKAIDEDVVPHLRSLGVQVELIERANTWVLDYHDDSGRWVDDPEGGGARVAAAVDCLFEAYGRPVGIVAHSMGGLAARWALAGDGRADKVSAVVTLGTPHTGSVVARLAAELVGVAEPTLDLSETPSWLIDLLRECGMLTSVDADACAPLPPFVAAFDSEAGQALRTGSVQLEKLAAWPDGIPVLSIAGDIEIVLQSGNGIFYQDVGSVTIGDGIVTAASAQARGTHAETGRCRHNVKSGYAVSDDARQLLGIHYDDNDERSGFPWVIATSPCWHGQLMTGVELTNQAVGFLDDHLPRSGYAMPALCGFEAATWTDLAHPDNASRAPAEASATSHTGDLDGVGGPDQVLAATCVEGTVAAERILVAFDADLRPLGQVPVDADLAARYERGSAPNLYENISIDDGLLSFDVSVWQPGDAQCCASLTGSMSYRYEPGTGFVLADLDIGDVPCSASRIARDLGEGTAVIDGLCLDGFAYVGTDELGDTQSIARLDGGTWTTFVAFPTPMCRSEAAAAGVPTRILDRILWQCETTATPGEAPVVAWDGEWRPAPTSGRVVQLGQFGDQVRWLQDALVLRGYDVDVDGYFGYGTEAAVRQFQRDRGLTVNGIATDEVWNQFGE